MKAEAQPCSQVRRGGLYTEVGGHYGESNFSVCLTQMLVSKCHSPLKETRAP